MLILYTYNTPVTTRDRGAIAAHVQKGSAQWAQRVVSMADPRALSVHSLKVRILSGLDGDVLYWVYLLTELQGPWTLPHLWSLKTRLGTGFRDSRGALLVV